MTAFGAARGKLPGTSEVFPHCRSVEKNSIAQKAPRPFLGHEAESVLSTLV